MKKFIIGCLIVSSVIYLPGCSAFKQTVQHNLIKETEKDLSRDKIFALLENAQKLESNFYSGKYTKDQVYDYFKSTYTKSYIDKTIFGGGNIKKENNYWVLAYPGSELIEGTSFDASFDDTTKVNYIDNKITVTNSCGDGLYAPHDEIITMVKENNIWLIDELKWEKKNQ